MEEKFKFKKISFWKITLYFIVYSVIGFIVETLYGLITKGVLESRQSFLYGPFCAIYGIGAIVMIYFLQYFKKNNYTIFIGGFIIGSVLEYLISWIVELIFNIKWWDYSKYFLNINGRICFAFSLFWGLLAIYLISHLNPIIDKIVEKVKQKISPKTLKIILITILIIIMIDAIITTIGLKVFYTRLVYEKNIELKNSDKYTFNYEKLTNNKRLYDLTLKIFSDEKLLKTFPNLKITLADNTMVKVESIFPEIQPYYIKFYTNKNIE